MKNIYIVGMMGAGKTCIGKIVAQKKKCRFIDTDTFVENRAGMSVAEIFEAEGEEGFRKRETEALRFLAKKHNCIISTGGGIILNDENIDLMRNSGTVIWLKRDLHKVLEGRRIRTRPLLAKDPTVIFDLMEKRKHRYQKACHYEVTNDEDRMAAAYEILRIIG
ncbi:MAG: shikimate kinase [Firmicutes bacterium]|nr:shikimate kinase [Bacillota bacterium]